MSKKKIIIRKDLVELLSLTREHYYGECLDDVGLQRRIDASIRIDEAGGPHWCRLENFISGLLGYRGIWKDATNWDIFGLLEQLGWEIVEEPEESDEAEETV